MTCDSCQTARTFPTYRFYSTGCLYCFARNVQNLGSYRIGASQCKERRLALLDEGERRGFDREEMRRLAKGPLALCPPPIKACVAPKKAKRR